jgi:hypothetical protein
VGLKLNGMHQLPAYADVNLLRDNICTIKKSTDSLIDDNKEVGLEKTERKLSICYCPITKCRTES